MDVDILDRVPEKCAILEGLESVDCNGGGGCSTSSVVVQHWEYFYDVTYYENTGQIIDITYSHRESRGQTTQLVTSCGSSGGTGSGNSISSVTSNPPEILGDDLAWPFPHCSSWEYANRMGVKVAGIRNINNTFYSYKVDSEGVKVMWKSITFPTLYFTAPSSWTNGRSSTLSSLAMQAAIDATANWYYANPDASALQVEQLWWDNLKREMAAMGGTVSRNNFYNLSNPAPYLTDLFTSGNCG